jgi:hypothetical protein
MLLPILLLTLTRTVLCKPTRSTLEKCRLWLCTASKAGALLRAQVFQARCFRRLRSLSLRTHSRRRLGGRATPTGADRRCEDDWNGNSNGVLFDEFEVLERLEKTLRKDADAAGAHELLHRVCGERDRASHLVLAGSLIRERVSACLPST